MELLHRMVDAYVAVWPEVFDCYRERLHELIDKHSGEADLAYKLQGWLLGAARKQCDNCQECECHKKKQGGACWADGNTTARVFVVGEDPDLESATYKLPFYSAGDERSVSRFDEAIAGLFTKASTEIALRKKLGSDIYIANTLKCPCYDHNGNSRTPTKTHTEPCSKWLRIQLSVVQPRIVIALGNTAGKVLFPDLPLHLTGNNSVFVPVTDDIRGTLPTSVTHIGFTYHPSAIDKKRNREEQLLRAESIRQTFEAAYRVLWPGKGET